MFVIFLVICTVFNFADAYYDCATQFRLNGEREELNLYAKEGMWRTANVPYIDIPIFRKKGYGLYTYLKIGYARKPKLFMISDITAKTWVASKWCKWKKRYYRQSEYHKGVAHCMGGLKPFVQTLGSEQLIGEQIVTSVTTYQNAPPFISNLKIGLVLRCYDGKPKVFRKSDAILGYRAPSKADPDISLIVTAAKRYNLPHLMSLMLITSKEGVMQIGRDNLPKHWRWVAADSKDWRIPIAKAYLGADCLLNCGAVCGITPHAVHLDARKSHFARIPKTILDNILQRYNSLLIKSKATLHNTTVVARTADEEQ